MTTFILAQRDPMNEKSTYPQYNSMVFFRGGELLNKSTYFNFLGSILFITESIYITAELPHLKAIKSNVPTKVCKL